MSFYASTGQPQDPAGQQPHPGHQSRPSQLPPPAIPHPSASPVGKGSSSSTTTGANSQQQQQTPATFKGLHQLTGAPTPPVPLSTVTAFGSGGLSGTGGGVGGGGLADGVSAVGGERGEREGGMSGGTAPGSSALGAGGEGGQHQQQQQVAGTAAGWGKNGSFGSSSVPEGVFEVSWSLSSWLAKARSQGDRESYLSGRSRLRPSSALSLSRSVSLSHIPITSI